MKPKCIVLPQNRNQTQLKKTAIGGRNVCGKNSPRAWLYLPLALSPGRAVLFLSPVGWVVLDTWWSLLTTQCVYRTQLSYQCRQPGWC